MAPDRIRDMQQYDQIGRPGEMSAEGVLPDHTKGGNQGIGTSNHSANGLGVLRGRMSSPRSGMPHRAGYEAPHPLWEQIWPRPRDTGIHGAHDYRIGSLGATSRRVISTLWEVSHALLAKKPMGKRGQVPDQRTYRPAKYRTPPSMRQMAHAGIY